MRRLRIGLITTWNTVCGIAEYSRALTAALRSRGHTVVILGNYPVNPVPGAADDGAVYRFFYTGWHRERGADGDLAEQLVAAQALDLVHLQYQNFIYPAELFPVFRRLAGRVPLVVTFHDPCVPPEFPRDCAARAIVHSAVTLRMLAWPAAVIPMGIHDFPAPPVAEAKRRLGIASQHVLCSVGLGRTDYRVVLPVLRDLVPRYPDLLWMVLGPEGYIEAVRHTAREMGVEAHVRLAGGFFPLQQLIDRMHAADMTVFCFPESGVEGVSSSSCRLGVAARRPAILTDVGWTRDLPDELKVPHSDAGALRDRVVRLFEDAAFRQAILMRQERLIREDGWARAAERHEAVYRNVLPDP